MQQSYPKTPIADKDSFEYRKKREKNNVAVRKSRAKAKHRRQELQQRLVELAQDVHTKTRTIMILQQENEMFRNFFKTFPDLQSYLPAATGIPNAINRPNAVQAALATAQSNPSFMMNAIMPPFQQFSENAENFQGNFEAYGFNQFQNSNTGQASTTSTPNETNFPASFLNSISK